MRVPGNKLHTLIGKFVLPQADITSWAGAPRPDEVADLLELADEDV
jgi:hypothetical protein